MRRRTGVQALSAVLANAGALGARPTPLIYPTIHCHACPASVFGCPLGELQSFLANGLAPLYPLGAIVLYGAILGRAWCGWVCPFGLLQDLASRGRRVPFGRRGWGLVRFVILALSVTLAALYLDTYFCKVCPVGTLEASLPVFLLEGLPPGLWFYAHLASLALVAAGFLLVPRFWCRYLCPVGAVLSLFNRLAPVRIVFDESRCTGCGTCVTKCPMGIDPRREAGGVNCILCLECVALCPAGALGTEVRVIRRGRGLG